MPESPGSTVQLISELPFLAKGLPLYGGKISKPTLVKGEIVKATVNVNGRVGAIKVVGNKAVEFQLLYSKAVKKERESSKEMCFRYKSILGSSCFIRLQYEIFPSIFNFS
jgi:hypothetical protein